MRINGEYKYLRYLCRAILGDDIRDIMEDCTADRQV